MKLRRPTIERTINRSLAALAILVAVAACLFFYALPAPPSEAYRSPALNAAFGLRNALLCKAAGIFASLTAMGLLACAWWLKRAVARPIARLAHAALKDAGADDVERMSHECTEIGSIARSIQALRSLSHEWRRHAESVERRMDSHLAQETQRIMDELQRVQRQAWLDPLTKLYNRRLLEEKFPQIYASQTADGQDLSVVMMDVDRFKLLNDTLGHAVGDEVLAFAGELLRQCMRSQDIAVRYGGDEFLLVLPGVTAHDARALARRVISLFNQRARMMAPIETPPRLTAGIASVRRNHPSKAADLIALADRAMYKAKSLSKRGSQCAAAQTRSCPPSLASSVGFESTTAAGCL